MIFLRHHSAVDHADKAWWAYDPTEKAISLRVARGTCTVSVCSFAAPRCFAYPIQRVDDSTWKILPTRFLQADTAGHLGLAAAAISDIVGREFVFLLSTPDVVSMELAELEL